MRPRALLVALLLAATALGAQAPPQYPPELPPIQPTVEALWVTADAPRVAADPAPPGQPVKILRLGPSNVFTSQAEFTAFCANLDTKDNIVYANAWATEPAGSVPTLIQTTGCLWLSAYVSPNNMNSELSALQQNATRSPVPSGVPVIPGITPTIRAQYHADMVVMYNNDASACGLGYVDAVTYGPSWTFSIVQKGCADSNFSDVHERGHNFGMQHDPPNAGGVTPLFPYAFGFCDTPHSRRDPMVYPTPCGGSRVAYFGNPSDTHFGYPFGNAATADGARVHRSSMPIVANFYPPLGPSCPTITLTPTTLTAGTVGTALSRQLAGAGGTGPYAFSVIAGTLPAGTTLSAAGLLSGTPTAAGTSTFTVRAMDANACPGSQAYSLTIACPTITLSPATLTSGQVGTAYTQALVGAGGTGPYVFAVTSGALPSGLTLTSAGVLSGTPTTAQTATFTIRATDAHGCAGSRAYSLVIAPLAPPPCPTITVFPTAMPTGYTGRAYTQTFTASGGTAPYVIIKTTGTLQTGLTYAGSTISGTPTAAGVASFTIQATDAATCVGTHAYTLTVLQLPTAPTNLVAVP